jgi:hypothetical protein
MRIINIGGHGIGDCILSLQIAYLLNKRYISTLNLISSRDEVYKPLWYAFGNVLEINQIDEKYSNNNALLNRPEYIKELKVKYESDLLTYNVPDLLFKNEFAFNYEEYGLNPQIIKKTRLLVNHFPKKENIIYCGLSTTTPNYLYKNIPLLLKSLGEHLPQYKIYFPKLKKWDKEINYACDFNIDYPSNVVIDLDPDFNKSLDILFKSKYGVFTCNGPSHIAYHLGIPRLLLDPQFNRIPWISRWKEDYEECINIDTHYNDVSRIVFNNINYPETTLIDRKILLNLLKNGYSSWKEIFLLKEK